MKKRISSVFFGVLLLMGIAWNNTTLAQTGNDETDCSLITLPWAYGAEEAFVSQGGSASHPNCWSMINGGDDNNKYYWTSKTGKDAHIGNQCIMFKGIQFLQKQHDDWLITPSIDFAGNEQISFWVTTNSTLSPANFHGRFSLYISNENATSSTDTANFDRIELTGANTVNNRFDFCGKAWQQLSVTLPSNVSGSRYLAFVVDTNSYSFYLDDIYIYAPSSCDMPTEVHATAITSNSIALAWTSSASSYTIYYDTLGANMNEASSVVSYGNNVEITDLLPNTAYNISVEASCSDGTLSVPTYPILITTACAPYPIESMPFYEDFSDNEVGVNSQLDDCWYKGNNSPSSKYPFAKKDKGRDDDTSVIFNATTSMYSYVVLPEMEEDISNLILSCAVRHSTSTTKNSDLLIGLVSNPNDITTMTVYDTLSPTTAGEWTDFVLPLYDFNIDDGHYIAFKMDNGQSGEAYLDNIKLEINTSSCDAPTSSQLVSVSSNTAEVAWTDEFGNAWRVYYDEVATDSIEARYVDVTTTNATLAGLTPQTEYEFWVVTDCENGEYSIATPKIAFTTTCGAISALPYTEDFESYESGEDATINPCWFTHCSDPNENYPYPSTVAAINGNRGLWLQAYQTTTQQYHSYAALPIFSEDITNLRVRFKIKKNEIASHSSDKFFKIALGVMSNPDDITTFDTIQVYDMQSLPNETVLSNEVAFSSYEGTGSYITFLALDVTRKVNHYAENIVFLDDVEVSLIPDCATPTEVVVNNPTGSSLDLSWNGSAPSYKVMYSIHQDMSDSTVLTANSNSIQLTNLASYTYYYIKVASLCADGSQSEWSYNPIVARTEMNCGEGFINYIDTIGEGTTADRFSVINGNNYHTNTCTWSIYTASELVAMGLTGNINWIKAISLQTKDAYAPLPVRIYMAHTDVDAFTSTCSDTITLSQMTLVYDHTKNFSPNSWNELVLDTPFNYDGSSNLMIAYERVDELTNFTEFYVSSTSAKRTVTNFTMSFNETTTAKTLRGNIIFNICGGEATCARPNNVAVSDVTATSLSLSWEGTASNYQVVYDVEDFDPNTITNQTVVNVAQNTTVISGLTPQTTYYFYVRAVCSNENSDWSVLTSMSTPCDAISELPYMENFDSYEGGFSSTSGQIINPCWAKGTNSGMSQYPFVYKVKSYSAPNSFAFKGATYGYCYAALPMFSEDLTHLSVSFKMMTSNLRQSGLLYIGVMSNQNDITTFEVVDSVINTVASEWQDFEIVLNNYQGSGKYIAFKMNQRPSGFIESYIDNLEVSLTPSCATPNGLVASNISTNSATIAWTDHAIDPEGGYELQYGVSGFNLGEGTTVVTSTNPTTLMGLSASATYDVYVRAICGNGDTSRWSAATRFSTNCASFALPVTFDFENYETGTSAPLPLCFNRYNDASSPSNSARNIPYVNAQYSSVQNFAHSGSKYLMFKTTTYSTDASTVAMSFPILDTETYPMNGNQVVFWARATNTAELVVGVMSDPSNISTFVAMDTINLDRTYHEYTVSFSSYTGNGAYPTMVMYQGISDKSAYVDDVRFEVIPPCATVSNLQVLSVTNNSAELTWTDTIGSTQWDIEYHTEGSATIQTVTANSNPFTLTGLNPLTKYIFNVRAICSTGETTSPTLIPGEFTTTQAPAILPYAYDFEDSSEWANWQTSSNVSTNWYRGDDVAGQGSNAMYISNDAGVTRGSNWNTLVNAVVYRDIDFGSDTSSFVMTFKANVGGALDENIAVSVMMVDPMADVNSSNSALTTPWGSVNDLSLLTVRQDSIWGTYRINFDDIAGIHRIAFYWYNPNLGLSDAQSDKAGAIDDIHIFEPTCIRSTDLSVTNLDVTSATLNWNGEASNYEVTYNSMVYGDEITDSFTQIVQGNSLTITNLMDNTDYSFWVRAICSDGDTSDRSIPAYFTTLCSRYSARDTIREDFTSVVGGAHNIPGSLPDCWESYSDGENGIAPHVVDSGLYYYTHNQKALIMSAKDSSLYGNNAVVRLPYTIEPLNTLTLSFWMGTSSSSAGKLQIGYLTGTDLATDFVAFDTIPASYYTKCPNKGEQPEGVGIYDTISFANVPAEAQVVALRWVHDGGIASVCIDDVELIAVVPCLAPEIQDITADFESATLTWNGEAANYQILYKDTTTSEWSDTISTANTSYTFTNLQSETTYQIQLRSQCGVDGNSEWVDTIFTTEMTPCYIPTDIAISDIQFEEATIDWASEATISKWVVRVYNTIDTLVDTTTVHPITVTGLVNSTTYKVDVQSVCSHDRLSERSEVESFTTPSCAVPTHVEASDITNNSAVITWSDDYASKWVIKYGVDIDQDSGEEVETSECTYTLTNLTEGTLYDVYVRSYCTESVFSNWSAKYSFSTLSGQEGIDGVDGNYHLVVYPNPTSGNTTISLNGVEGKVAIAIIDMNGRTITSESIECGAECQKRFDVSGLAQGTYFVRVLGNNINSVRKLIVR